MPLRVAKAQKTQKGLSDFDFWANRKQVRDRVASRPRGDRAAYRTEMRNLNEAWSAMTAYAKADVRRRRLASSHVTLVGAGGKSYSDKVGNALFSLGLQQ